MDDETLGLEKVVLTRLLRLNATIHGTVSGLVVGFGIFVATNWLLISPNKYVTPEGEVVVGQHLSLLSQFFPGYEVTFVGSLIGLAYGFVSGFAGGYLIARIYNWLVDLRERRQHA